MPHNDPPSGAVPIPADENAPYLTLREVFEKIRTSRDITRGQYVPAVVKAMSITPELFDRVERDLDKEGFRRFRYFREGANAIILETVDNQLVRVSLPAYDTSTKIYHPRRVLNSTEPSTGYGVLNSRIWHPVILQPIRTHDYEDEGKPYVRCEILPKVHRIYNGIKEADKEKVRIVEDALQKSGIGILDIDNNNVGSFILPDGRELLLALDVGMATFRKDPRTCWKGEHLKPWLGAGGHFLQCELDPRIRPHRKREGAPSGVVPDDMIEAYERSRRQHHVKKPSAITALLGRRLYPEEIHGLMMEAADNNMPPVRGGYYTRLIELADKYDAGKGVSITSNGMPGEPSRK